MMQYISTLQTSVKTVLSIQCALLKANLLSTRLFIAVKKLKLHELRARQLGSCACQARDLSAHQRQTQVINDLQIKLGKTLRLSR